MAKAKKDVTWIWVGRGVVHDDAFKENGEIVVPMRGDDVTARVKKLSGVVVDSLVRDGKIADLESEVTAATAEKAKRERMLAALQQAGEKSSGEEGEDETP